MVKKMTVALGIVSLLASASVAFAQTESTPATVASASPAQPMILQVSPAGKVTLRGTVVTASASSVTIKSWGGNWTINVPESAQVLPQGTHLANFATGDFIGVQGTVDQGASWTVTASLIRDRSAHKAIQKEIRAAKKKSTQ